MTVMTEVQVWVLMGLFTTMVTVMFAVIQRSLATGLDGIRTELRSEIGGLHREIGGLRSELRAEVGGLDDKIGGLRGEMNARFDAVDTRFDAVDRQMDGFDRDIHMLVARAVDGDSG